MEHNHTAKGGPFRHFHHIEDEWFYVLEGEYRVEVGGELHTLKAGGSNLDPRGIPHVFAPAGSRPRLIRSQAGPTSGRMLITYAPAGRMEEFFSFQDQDGGRKYSPNPDLMLTYGMERVGPPPPSTNLNIRPGHPKT